MTITTVTTIAATNAAQAQRAAHDAHVERCKVELLTFQTKNSHNVQEMQSYAQCVEVVYPMVDSRDIVTGKIIVAVLLLSAIIGAVVVGYKERDGLIAILGGILGLGMGFVGILAGVGVMFLFS